MKKILIAGAVALIVACGEDRSGEQPFPPTVQTVSAVSSGSGRLLLTGNILTSPNSRVTERGFVVFNDTMHVEVASADTLTSTFTAEVDSIDAGLYRVAAFAVNGMGSATGDTLSVEVWP